MAELLGTDRRRVFQIAEEIRKKTEDIPYFSANLIELGINKRVGENTDDYTELSLVAEVEKIAKRKQSFSYKNFYFPTFLILKATTSVSIQNLVFLLRIENEFDGFSLQEMFGYVSAFQKKHQESTIDKYVNIWIEAVKEYASIEISEDGVENIVLDEGFFKLPFEWQFGLAESRAVL